MDERAVVSQWEYKRDLVLPADFGRNLQGLVERGVACLIVYAFTERSLHYLRTAYGKTIAALEAAGGVQLTVIDRDSHIFSKDHVAVDRLNEVIDQWVARAFAAQGAAEARVEPVNAKLTAHQPA